MNLLTRAKNKLKFVIRHFVKQGKQRACFVGSSGNLAVELRIADLARELALGLPFSLTVCALNTGKSAWPKSDDNALRLGVRWRWAGDSADFCFDEDGVAKIPGGLAPGEKVTLTVNLTAPNTAGNYDLVFDVASARDGWFRTAPAGRIPHCRVHGADARHGEVNYDYRTAYASLDLDRDYWTIVGPGTKEEFETLGRAKMDALVTWGLTPDARILDVGCGTGQLTQPLLKFLSDRGAYCGTDLAEPAIAFCKRRYTRPNFRFLRNDMTTLPLSNEQFDFIYLGSVFTHMFPEETRAMLRQLRELLSPTGKIIADAFHSTAVDGHLGSRDMVVVNETLLDEIFSSVGLSKSVLMCIEWNPTTKRSIFGLEPVK